MNKSWDVVVVGSCMVDFACYAPRFPKDGETLVGTNFRTGCGGKGFNQSVAARKLGAKSVIIAGVGKDSFGKDFHKKLEEFGIPDRFLKDIEEVNTGFAQITVVDSGENNIIIVPGANNKLDEEDVEKEKNAIINCKILLCQMEIPEKSTVKALQIKAENKIGKSILNVAPATWHLHPLLFSLPDIVCVNEREAEILTGMEGYSIEDLKPVMEKLIEKGFKEVVITVGEEGCIYGKKGGPSFVRVPSPKVSVVDTTGAGDAFVGALAYYMSNYPELPMEEILRKANIVASISVQRLGTIDSYPTMAELPPDILGW